MIGVRHFSGIIIIALLAAAGSALAAEGIEVRALKGDASEQYERDVDTVALSAQEKAITRLQALLAKYRGTRQEPILLAKLGDLQQQAAAIAFRLSHGQQKGKKASEQTRYQKVIQSAIQTYSTLIAKYPHYEEIPHAYFARGKSYEEISEKAKATSDYLHLVKTYPEAEEAPTAYMSLAEFAIQDNDHAKAISYLKEVEKNPEGPHYPFALYKLAWSYYNLKNIPAALSHAERQVAFYNNRGVKADGSSASDAALRENMLLDMAIFYFEGYEQKAPTYQLTHAYPYFSKIENGPVLGKMLVRFSKLLRSHNNEADLVAFKDELLQKESDRPETLDVLITTYEYQLNKRRFPQLVESAQDMVRLYAHALKSDKIREKILEGFPRAQKLVLDTAQDLQSLIIKNKSADDVRGYSVMLASLYDAFTRIVEEKDERIPRVHYNLAETLFAIKDFAGATEHYRWVVDHGRWDADKVANVPDASLKAIASRYEVLREKKLIPTELAAKPFPKGNPPSLEPLLAQWVEWIDTHVKRTTPANRGDTDNFVFEANRALYAQGHIGTAVERLHAFARKHPDSAFGTSSASLVLDTTIASEDWEKTHELALELLKTKSWKSEPAGAFSKRLFAVAADSFYKRVEGFHKSGNLAATLKSADEFLERYGESARLADTLTVAGAAALALKDKPRAETYFSRLIRQAETDKSVSPANLASALLARAALAEENYRFAEAAADFRRALDLPSGTIKMSDSQASDLRKKTLALIWLADDFAELRKALGSKTLCTEALQVECEKYTALAVLGSPERANQETTDDAFEKARKDSAKEVRAIWAVVALEGAKNLAFRDRNVALRTLASSWEDLDPMVRYTLLPSVSASVAKAFELNRHALRDVAPLRADEKYITRRVEVIREMENAATKIVKLPWARIKSQTLNEIAETYIDFSRGLTALKPPKGLNDAELGAYQDTIRKLVLPFEEKGQEMRAKAFELASRSAVEEDTFQRISEPFFAENPSQAKKLRLASPVARPAALELPLLTQLDPAGEWKDVQKSIEKQREPKATETALRLKLLWAKALQAKRWAQVAFFLSEAREKSLVPAGTLGVIKAVSLASAGARAEALNELDETKKELSFEGRMAASTLLMHHYLSSFNREKTQSVYKAIVSEVASQKDGKGQAVPKELAQEQATLNSIASSVVQ